MIAAIETAHRLDWGSWILGLWGAAVSGGAGAIGSGFGGIVIGMNDPDHYLLKFNHMLLLVGSTFLLSSIVSLAKWLQLNPVPHPMTINTPGPVNVTQNFSGETKIETKP